MSKRKYKSFARWDRGMDNKLKQRNMKEEKKELEAKLDKELDKTLEDVLENTNINLGFIYEPIAPEDCPLGSLEFGREIIMPSGDWSEYLPGGEDQQRAGVETMACVSFSACNNIEIIFNWMIRNGKISDNNLQWLIDNGYIVQHHSTNNMTLQEVKTNPWNYSFEYSDRCVAKLSGTTTNGNSLKNVGETIRKHGLVPESKWPFSAGMTWAEYYKYPSGEVLKLGRDFLERFQINYEVVPESQFKDGLKYAPLQTAVHAWNGRDSEGNYVKSSGTLNHAISLFKKAAVSLLWGIFDHYKLGDSFIKWLKPDFNLMDYGYRYIITEKKPQIPAPSPYASDVVFVTPCSGYLNYAPTIILDKGTGLNKDEAMVWVPAPKQGESLPATQYDVNPRKEESGWQLLLRAIKKLLGYGR